MEGVTLHQLRDLWLDDLVLEGRSPATVRTYRSLLRNLPDCGPHDLTPEVCRRLVGERMGQARASARTFHGALKSFVTYLGLDAMDKVPRPRKITHPHRYLSKPEIRRLWAVCDDRPLFLLLISGLRASEAVGLRWEDVEGDVAWIRGKGDRYRRIVLPEAFEAIPRGAGPVLGYDYYRLRRKVRRWGRAAKMVGVHPHLLRHSWATHALMEGMDVITLQNQGGWADTAMITHYAQSALESAALERARKLRLVNLLLDT